jgi:hypothetical protein
MRIARVAETTARRGTSSASTPALVPSTTISGDAPTQLESPATASLHDVVPGAPLVPFEKALVTEYGSPVGADAAPPEPRRIAPVRWMVGLGMVMAFGLVAKLSMQSGPAPATGASVDTAAPRAASAAILQIAPAPSVVKDAADAAAASAPPAATPAKSASRAGPRDVPHAASAKPPKNPMDIEFR